MIVLRIKNFLVSIKNFFLLTCAKLLYGHLDIKNNKIVVDNFLGKGYGDNPKYICEELLKSMKPLDIVWVSKDTSITVPCGIRVVKYGTLRALKEYYTSKIWIDNVRNSFKPSKRKQQFYIQTWHGNLGNKRVEGASVDSLSKEYIRIAKKDAAQTDLMISGSTFFTNLIKEYFWYNGKIFECGTPRLDVFFSNHQVITKNVKKYYGIDENVRMILYAPTFRANNYLDCYDLNYEQVLSAFEELYGCKCILLIRFHPNVNTHELVNITYASNIIDATKYNDLYELIIASSAVITDYSSISFEAGIIKKPVFIYANDLNSYVEERGFYIDIYEQPFPVSTNQNELKNRIASFDYIDYEEKLESFNTRLGIKEYGDASKKIAKRIMKIISE